MPNYNNLKDETGAQDDTRDMAYDAAMSKIRALNSDLAGLDLPANTPEFNTGLGRPQIGGAGLPANMIPKRPSNAGEDLFDYSRLNEIPKVPQIDLERYVPARGVPARVQDVMANQDVKNKMLQTIKEGQEKGGANWYNADPLRDRFIENLGAAAGDQAFRKYMDMVAATSPRSDVGTNVRNASYYYQRAMAGEPMPEVGTPNPQPYGHMAQRLHQMNAQRVAGEGWDALNNPKPASFVENLVGNQAPVTVDTHAFRLPAIHAADPRFLETAFQVNKDAPKQNIQKMVTSGEMPLDEALGRAAYWQAQPKENEYGAMEQYYKSLGQELGLSPAQTQASAWVGGGKLTGLASDESKPFLRFFQDRIYKTANELKMDPNDVMDRFIKGEMTLRASGGEVNGDHDIAHALRLATGGRAHFDDGGDVRGGDNPGGLSGDTGRYATGDVGESQGEVNAAIAKALDAQQSLRSGESFDSNAPATPSKSIQEATSLATALPLTAGVDPADTAMAKQVLSQQRQDAFSAAQAQANAAENRAMAANAAMAQRVGLMTGQPETPTFTGNTTEEQQLKDAEASRQAGINAAITGANYTAPGTVNVADVVAPTARGFIGNAFTEAAQPAPNPYAQGQMPQPLGSDLKTPGQPAFNPYAQGQMPQPSGAELRTPSQDAVVANALVKAATFEPSQNAALRAARDAITQNMGQPDITVPRTTGSGSVPLADLPAAKVAPQATTTANETPRIPVDSLEDPALIAAYNAQYGLSGPKNTRADMALGQRIPNVTTDNPLINTVQGANNFLTNLFTPSYNLGSDQYNQISQNPEPEPMTTFGGHGGGQQQVQAAPVTEAAAAAPVAAPVVPGTPVPYTYAKRMPYLDYGAYGAGIGNIAPISYADPINWALVPGYRAAGGRVGENNALANVLRMLAQNRS